MTPASHLSRLSLLLVFFKMLNEEKGNNQGIRGECDNVIVFLFVLLAIKLVHMFKRISFSIW